MKLNTFFKLSLIILVVPLANVNFVNAIKKQNQDSAAAQDPVKEATNLIKDFLDLNKNPQKNFEQYINELIKILKPNPKYKEVCEKLETIKKLKKHTAVSAQLLKLKSLLPESICLLLKERGTGPLLRILKARVK